ncbi:MAG: hypothetical protein ACPG4Y_09320 [Chitinophagales bacterium]
MIKKLKQNNYFVFIAYLFITLALYFSTQGAGMVFDFNGWLSVYETGTYKDVVNSFGYQGLHQVEQFCFFSFYKMFGYSHFAWYFAFAVMHAVAAFVSFMFLKIFLKTIQFSNYFEIALLASFMFLISPLAADTVVNKVTVHYFTSFISMLLAFYFEVKYFENKKIKYLIFILLLFIIALFSLEIAYIFPVMFALLWLSLLYFNNSLKTKLIVKSPIFLPFIILIAFLFLHRIVLGSFVGHYGAEVHTKFDVAELFSNTMRYFSAYLLLFDHWVYKLKDFASQNLYQFAHFFIILIALVLVVLFFILKKKYLKQFWLGLLFLALALFALAPIANLYYTYIFPIENNRYSYFSSIFIYAFVAFLYYQIKWKIFRSSLIIIFISLNTFFLFQNINTFNKSSTLAWNLLNDFRWFEDDVIILVDPDNFNGAKMFTSIGKNSSFAESLKLHTRIDRIDNIHLVYQMNFNALTDSVLIEQINENTLKVEIAQWGNWFWHKGIGASSFENKLFKATRLEVGKPSFELELSKKARQMTIVYAAGDKWREFKLKK